MAASYPRLANLLRRRHLRKDWTRLALCALSLLLPSGAAGDWAGGGPEIGWVRSLLEASDGTLYAGTFGGGIFRSADGGRNWQEATTNAADAVVLDLAESANGTLFAATADRTLLRKEATSDFWFSLGGFPTGDQPPGLSIGTFPGRPSRIAFGSDYGAFISNNLGANWPDTLQFAAGQQIQDLVVLPQSPDTVHALTPLELVVTSDGGQSEDFYSEGLAPVTFMLDLEPWPVGTDSLLVADQTGPVWQFVDRQRFVDVGPDESGTRTNKYAVRIDPEDPDRVLLGSSAGLWISEDRLVSWDLVADAMPAAGAEIWALDPGGISVTDSLRLGSFTLGFLRTSAGGQPPWTVSNRGLTAAWARTVDPGPGSVLCGTAHGRLYRTSDEGESWEDVTGALRTLQISVSHQVNGAWLVSGFTGVVRSDDQGSSWVPVTLPAGVQRLNEVRELGGVVFAATNAGLVASDDDGASFALVPGLPTGRNSFALGVSGEDEVLVAFDPPSGSTIPSIHVGHPQSGFSELLPPPGFRGRVRAIARVDGDLLVGTTGFGGTALYRVRQNEFTDLAPEIGDGFFEVRDMVVRANLVAVGTTEDGVFLSEDAGQRWREYNEGLPTRRIEALAFTPVPDRRLWVATLGRGAFSREIQAGVALAVSGLTVEAAATGARIGLEVAHPVRVRVRREGPGALARTLYEGRAEGRLRLDDPLPAAGAGRLRYLVELEVDEAWFEVMSVERDLADLVAPRHSRLLGAVPNPFNPQTTLRFELASAGPVILDLFDARGRRVRRLVERDLRAGPHALSFDGRDDAGVRLASGVYFLLLRTSGSESRGRITLLR